MQTTEMYYIQVDSLNKVPVMLWYLKDGVATRVGVSNTGGIPAAQVPLLADEDIFQAMKRQFSEWYRAGGTVSLHRIALKPGEYYPRIARPSNAHPQESLSGSYPDNTEYKNEIALLKGQFITLIGKLNEICRTIHPDVATLSAYGHEIRNLLILACTEIESHWRGVLHANGIRKASYTTKDYVKLLQPMRLNEYEVAFPNYPWLAPIKPFEKWGAGVSPTKDIEWYAAYNAAKHDRDNYFPEANLGNAFKAVTACAVMLYAQFGAKGMVGRNTEILQSFHFINAPKWHPSEVYILPIWEGHIAPWKPINYPF